MAPQIPLTMKAAQLVEYNKQYKIGETVVPKDLHPRDLLLKVGAASLCHTDGMVAMGIMGSPLPITASHEGAGTVVAMGSDVKGWEIGDRCMVSLTYHPCGQCSNCRGPEETQHYCVRGGPAPGIFGDGAFAEYMVADSVTSSKIPKEVPDMVAAPMACAGRTVYRGIAQAKLQPGQWIGIIGSGGGLGHLGIAFAKIKGFKVVGIDARDAGLDLSRDCGADVVLDARKGKEEVVRQVMEATGEGCNATLNLSDADSAAALAAAVTRDHGRVIQVAQPSEVKIPFMEFVMRDIKFEGSLVAGKRQLDEMLQMVAEHGIGVKTFAMHGVEKVPELVELAHSGKLQGKGLIIMDA